jgi:hypothetical protein
LVARSAAPESTIRLAAMRELANMTARGAIDTHSHKRWSRAALEKLGISIGIAGVGVGLLFWAGENVPLHLTGIAALVVAIYWGWQALALVRNMRSIGRRNTKFLKAAPATGSKSDAAKAAKLGAPRDAQDADGAEAEAVGAAD